MAVSFKATLSPASGATMRGCFVLMVSVPVEGPVLAEVVVTEVEVDRVVGAVPTIGIVR